MNRKTVCGIMLALLLEGMVTLALNIPPVEATGTIYIRSEGSVDPPTANIITVDNLTYAFISNINGSIVIERDNIVVDGAGYTLQGTGNGKGMKLLGRSNVTIKNTKIEVFEHGIWLYASSNNSISGNSLTGNYYGIMLLWSSGNTISENSITNNYLHATIFEYSSNHNSISENNIENNYCGLFLVDCSSNSISGNNVTGNSRGISLYSLQLDSHTNEFHQNNFIENIKQVHIETPGYANVWDDSYPSGGNYWSNYAGMDLYSSVNQNEAGHDWIGDTPYIIDENNQDSYPLIDPYIPEIQEIQVTYRNLLGNHNKLLSDFDQLNFSFTSIQDEISTLQNLMYIFIATTMIFIATTVYIAVRKLKART